MADSKEMTAYVEDVLKKLADTKEANGLTDSEIRLGRKLQETQDSAESAMRQKIQLESSMGQMQQRIFELEKKHLEKISKASGFAEALIALKFGEELDKKREAASKGEGEQK